VHVDEVHDEAERLEHVLSEELEARIDKTLGFPTHDPHGDPIPDANLEWPAKPSDARRTSARAASAARRA
jgi:DtxR family Mn-dependent transcriptional regulator